MKKKTFCVRFYCKESKKRKDGTAPIEVSVIVSGMRELWQEPMKCRPEDFDKDLNAKMYCDAIRNQLNEIYTNLTINKETITAFKIKEIYKHGNAAKSYTLATLFKEGLKMKASEDCETGTYNKYKIVSERFFEWTGLNENMEADRVTATDIKNFRIAAEKVHEAPTVVKEMRNLKYFFSLAFNDGKIQSHPFASIKIGSAENDKTYLTYSELLQIKKSRITDNRLDRTRDIFLFMCFTGIEWADLIELKKEDVKQNDKKQWYIQKPRVKTKIEYVSILYEDAVDIWKFYDGELPLISSQKFNANLKDLAKAAGIEKEITSLTARHSFACYLINTLKLKTEIVARMLGHKSLATTRHYAKTFAETVFEENSNAVKPKQPHRYTYMEYLEDKEAMESFEKNFLGR